MSHPVATLDRFRSIADVFGVRGFDMRTHKGRSVTKVSVDGRACYLKRYWLAPSQLFKRHVGRGCHELRMIDWLNDNGFAAPRVVARGRSTWLSLTTKMYFLMEEVPGEVPLEQAWWGHPDAGDDLLAAAATFAARLHDRGFIHTDFSERHILVGRHGDGWTFRLIDLERARTDNRDERLAAADLKTLAASVAAEELRGAIESRFLDTYIAQRRSLPPGVDMRSLFAQARATKVF